MTSKYLYCIIPAAQTATYTSQGVGDTPSPLHTITHRELTAIVSNSPLVTYERSRRHMLAHTQVLEEVMQTTPILPVQFGTVAPTSEQIERNLLINRYDELCQKLTDIKGRVELSLKTIWYQDAVFQEIVAENPNIQRLRDSLVGKRPEETYYERIQLGQQVEQAMHAKRHSDASLILNKLTPLALKSKIRDPQTERMVVNAAFLVAQNQESAFDEAVNALDEQLGHRMKFKYLGPVPPYNFVNIIVHWDD